MPSSTHILAQDPNSRVACETLVTTGQVVLAGEVTTNAYVDAAQVARKPFAKSVIPTPKSALTTKPAAS